MRGKTKSKQVHDCINLLAGILMLEVGGKASKEPWILRF